MAEENGKQSFGIIIRVQRAEAPDLREVRAEDADECSLGIGRED